MEKIKKLVVIAAIAVFLICLYSFLVGNKVFDGQFENEAIPWYFLAKGIFCSISMYLLVKILEAVGK